MDGWLHGLIKKGWELFDLETETGGLGPGERHDAGAFPFGGPPLDPVLCSWSERAEKEREKATSCESVRSKSLAVNFKGRRRCGLAKTECRLVPVFRWWSSVCICLCIVCNVRRTSSHNGSSPGRHAVPLAGGFCPLAWFYL